MAKSSKKGKAERNQQLMKEVLDIEEPLASISLGGLNTQKIYHGNFLKLARSLPDSCIDVAIIDPPYNASKGKPLNMDKGALPGTGGVWKKTVEVWDDMPLDDYIAFTLTWLEEVRRVLKPTGSMWVHGTYHNAGIVNLSMQLIGVEIINEVIWYKRNSFPNLAGRRLTASHETIIWAHKGGKRKYCFNYKDSKAGDYSYDSLKVPGKQMRTVWDIPNNKDPVELAYGKHPTQKPLRLSRRLLKLSSLPGGVCLVPFAGSGTECVAAQAEGLHYIGFELESSYVEIARRRLSNL